MLVKKILKVTIAYCFVVGLFACFCGFFCMLFVCLNRRERTRSTPDEVLLFPVAADLAAVFVRGARERGGQSSGVWRDSATAWPRKVLSRSSNPGVTRTAIPTFCGALCFPEKEMMDGLKIRFYKT